MNLENFGEAQAFVKKTFSATRGLPNAQIRHAVFKELRGNPEFVTARQTLVNQRLIDSTPIIPPVPEKASQMRIVRFLPEARYVDKTQERPILDRSTFNHREKKIDDAAGMAWRMFSTEATSGRQKQGRRLFMTQFVHQLLNEPTGPIIAVTNWEGQTDSSELLLDLVEVMSAEITRNWKSFSPKQVANIITAETLKKEDTSDLLLASYIQGPRSLEESAYALSQLVRASEYLLDDYRALTKLAEVGLLDAKSTVSTANPKHRENLSVISQNYYARDSWLKALVANVEFSYILKSFGIPDDEVKLISRNVFFNSKYNDQLNKAAEYSAKKLSFDQKSAAKAEADIFYDLAKLSGYQPMGNFITNSRESTAQILHSRLLPVLDTWGHILRYSVKSGKNMPSLLRYRLNMAGRMVEIFSLKNAPISELFEEIWVACSEINNISKDINNKDGTMFAYQAVLSDTEVDPKSNSYVVVRRPYVGEQLPDALGYLAATTGIPQDKLLTHEQQAQQNQALADYMRINRSVFLDERTVHIKCKSAQLIDNGYRSFVVQKREDGMVDITIQTIFGEAGFQLTPDFQARFSGQELREEVKVGFHALILKMLKPVLCTDADDKTGSKENRFSRTRLGISGHVRFTPLGTTFTQRAEELYRAKQKKDNPNILDEDIRTLAMETIQRRNEKNDDRVSTYYKEVITPIDVTKPLIFTEVPGTIFPEA